MEQDPNRLTGRTFRLLLKVLLEASQGKKVYVITHRKDYAMRLFDRAMVMAGDNARQEDRLQMRIGEGLLIFSGPIKADFKKYIQECCGFTLHSDHYIG